MANIKRVLRNIRSAIPSGVGLGRLSPGDGPVEFIPLADYQKSALDAISTVRGSILYRGSAGWTALAPGTSGKFLKTQGAGADPLWDVPAGGGGNWWASPPATTDFGTTVTEGSASSTSFVDDSNIGLVLGGIPDDNDYCYARVTAPPSAPFTITAHLSFSVSYGSGGGPSALIGGIILRNSSTGLRVVFGIDPGGGPAALIIRRATGTTPAADVAASSLNAFGGPGGVWLKIVVTTDTAIDYYVSLDGKNFTLWQSDTANVRVSGLDQIGLAITRRGRATQPGYLACDQWSAA